MPILPPWPSVSDERGGRCWRAPAPEASLRPAAGGMIYLRAGAESGAVIPAAVASRLRWELRLGAETLVIGLDTPVLVPAGGEVSFWLEIPLVRALVAEGLAEPLDQQRPGARRAILGRVDAGAVHPAVRAPLREGPEDPALAPHSAALRVRAQSRAETDLSLRRLPVHEPSLRLWTRGERAACGDVHVLLEHDHQAEARATAGEPPPGWEPVAEEVGSPAVPALSWLMDTARRAVEFQP